MKEYSKTQKIIHIILPFVMIPVLYFVGKFLSHYAYLYPGCPIYNLLHIHCPGCGMTRAFTALLHGDILLSIRQNIFCIISVIVSVWLYIEFLFKVFGKKAPFSFNTTFWAWVALILCIIYFVIRNVFPALAPI